MTAATVVRRVLFTLAPIEIGLAVAIFAGATIPPPLRIAIAVLVLITVLVEISILAAKIHGLCRGGAGFRRATVQAGREVIGERLWGLISTEVGMFAALGRLVARRPNVPAGAQVFTSHRDLARLMWILVPLTVLESVVVHFLIRLLVPWPAVGIVVLILTVYGLLWVLGYVAGIAMNPHCLDDGTFLVRNGPRTCVSIPSEDIERVSPHNTEGLGLRPAFDDGSHTLSVPLVGRTNVAVTLRRPLHTQPLTEHREVRTVRFFVDDPREVVRHLRSAIDNVGESAPR
ncbi:hypothetical protein [Gordonia sp. (in: high G+C Gram-positive bacteria)]|uniref:hypothetical protein n=1 Tax=Gordonia sp. (in: high G+C Gram-positive bacteria) TaxID=84139 RepID=UPI001D1B4A08|nr:hypothetical protein [Gordonia sp. (in: high G+C Gram-positive bacteria)]MCB1297273.1 hypothetical protein [Gordonia sp. (in: high G+C Gram-positive bacteria)]HMS77067.1 hypothetical protein [Gordonia sp. (in: high G+C Gram-positive bacteria)]HQV16969.1 hypothetical protein [Gordonia sp. (in: high G+C Gram-positive bacteria)]